VEEEVQKKLGRTAAHLVIRSIQRKSFHDHDHDDPLSIFRQLKSWLVAILRYRSSSDRSMQGFARFLPYSDTDHQNY